MQHRAQIVAEYMSSGCSQAAFARRAGVRLGPDMPAPPAMPELSVTLPGGLVARGADAAALAVLVRALLAEA